MHIDAVGPNDNDEHQFQYRYCTAQYHTVGLILQEVQDDALKAMFPNRVVYGGAVLVHHPPCHSHEAAHPARGRPGSSTLTRLKLRVQF